ncbi:HD-GYP domain-containing protein [Paenisporosarcina quisquiliarum]|uniref:HD-GYP domain-containing protein n=1 Tax=Paenisporosarcina quisquiliarum TaxID=365346 RepID=A0A9X3LGZ6_9BACL|nr:HD-GYP domain-containing protein [Paenisporosarcina quisquiliarum]MCZ8536826.1 HD-GYP domain-containing protein [Paenisporosarcina quisquiliarum]
MTLSIEQIIDIKEKTSLHRNDVGHAISTYIGKSDEIGYSLFSLLPRRSFWVRYSTEDVESAIEKYTVVQGKLEVQYEGDTFFLHKGDTLDASEYPELLSFYGEEAVEILVEMTASVFERNFRNTEIVQRDAASIERVDGYTFHHCSRIKDYSIELWKKLGQPIERVRMLRWGAYFHDIGKLAIPLEILNKKEKFTPEEWEIMKSHTTLGAQMMREHEIEWLRDSAFIVEEHHERFDGKGYPYGLKEDEISLEAAIVSVVDSFDAMTTDRIYRDSLTVEEAIQEIIRGRGTQFNPVVVDAFLKLLHEQQFKWR